MSAVDPSALLDLLESDPLAPHRAALAGDDPPPVRRAWAAVRIVMLPSYAALDHSPERPGPPEEIAAHVDWERTLDQRRRLDGLGFGIAEAMDTAQRFQVGWPVAQRLIRESGSLGLENGLVAGAGVDHLEAPSSSAELVDGVVHQARVIAGAGGVPLILPMLHLAHTGADEAAYVDVYDSILRQLDGPLLVHWLGEAFHPDLGGYFPGESFERVMALDPSKVRGAKLSLLDAERERRLRRSLASRGQVVLTGDDLHFGALIEGDDPSVRETAELAGAPLPLGDFSHALLGVLDALAEPMALALRALARGDLERYRALVRPCEALGRHLFQPPTERYKAGLALVAWLGGLQDNDMLANHEQRGRDREHRWRAAELAARAGALADRATARERLTQLLEA